MGRELNRKENKRNGKKVRDAIIIDDNNPMNEVYKFLKVILIIFVCLIVIYLLIGIFITKEISFSSNKDNTEVTIYSDYILASELFRQKEEKYYVYFYDFEDSNSSIESAINSKYSDERVYRVDIKSGFNHMYMGEDSNYTVSKKEDLKINGVTLIAINNGKNVAYVEGVDNIVSYINK